MGCNPSAHSWLCGYLLQLAGCRPLGLIGALLLGAGVCKDGLQVLSTMFEWLGNSRSVVSIISTHNQESREAEELQVGCCPWCPGSGCLAGGRAGGLAGSRALQAGQGRQGQRGQRQQASLTKAGQ